VNSRRRGSVGPIRRGAKSIALLGAVLILVAQGLAVAHFHQVRDGRQVNSQSQVVADNGLCALCILAFHAPFNPAATPAISRPFAELRLADVAVAGLRITNPFSSYRTRAPPAAVA
jgi:hypothetical protein